MTYIVNFTDSNNKTPLQVYDNSSSADTSLVYPGRNVTGYGQIIAENFLHLLENFSNSTAPSNAIEGQLWYDSVNGILNLFDSTTWKAASGIQKGPSQPSVATAKAGELWVDTANQQLRIFTGNRWVLVGPTQSTIDGLRYGPLVETIADTDNVSRSILSLYVADIPIVIVSKDSFTPKISISGFLTIKSGININTPTTTTQKALFQGGYLPKFYGTAVTADALLVSGSPVDSATFLRSDQVNTTEHGFNVRSSSGITLGSDGTFRISTAATSATIYNSSTGQSIDLQTNRNGIPSTILRVIENRVGINVADPVNTLDVDGDVGITGALKVLDTTLSSSLSTGSIVTEGGIAVSKNILVGQDLSVSGNTYTHNHIPAGNDQYNLGTSVARWNTVRAKEVIADTITGTLNGTLAGRATEAGKLSDTTGFSLTGDVIAQPINFDGTQGTVAFHTQFTANIIKDRPEPNPNYSIKSDYVLVYRSNLDTGASVTTGLIKQSRDTFIGDLGVPLGGIMPYAGAIAPYGYLLCDGSEVEIAKFPDLYNIIGTTYNIPGVSNVGVRTFRLPDLRGRFPLGRDNMDNGNTVPNTLGGQIDAGGGTAGRVGDIKAQTLAGSAGLSSTTIDLSNLPDHEHSLSVNGVQYAAVRVDTSINPPAQTGLGPSVPGAAQYLQTSGGILKPNAGYQLGQPIGIMNPYLTLNYIIRSGPPLFSTTV